MALSTQPYKGARDFYPEDKRLQKWVFATMRQVVERFGYEQYDAPIVEPLDLYLSKTSEEIVTEQTYSFQDRGGRSVTLRPEMTPTVSRMVAARRQELAYPLRWYSIPNLWRYERPQRGRLREHWQLNVDLFGIAGIEADFETIQVADALVQAFKAKRDMYTIRINSRKLINHILHDYLGLNETQAQTMIRLIDGYHKMSQAEFLAKLDAVATMSQREEGVIEKIQEVLAIKSLKGVPVALAGHESLAELDTLMQLCDKAGISNVKFDITLMRGFDYYTDIVFEVFDNHPDNNRSMFGGGRYDGLVELFGVESVPTVGFGMGDVTLANFLELHQLLPTLKSETDLYVILIGDTYAAAQKALQALRQQDVRAAVDFSGRKLDKQLKTADKKGIRFVLFIGEAEIESQQFKLKDLHTGQEETHGLERIISLIKDHRKVKPALDLE